ncbi:putative RNA polymerase ii subunit b1 ctd phosphatase rpap2 homolog [Phtheirospermum japonicum]|uniref:RNA polymerase II subunit B1 CTD phosphatase RPAP2 homolog n=1 Tax=Phtheirospermum japonicum TaxID=374723 RepID=A0A830BE82_9LAMI|nr:putative RNA polymerase ii subunit b1 ctd phosphatase rpap2 homolog [Phtheirospermum japonicum]
MKKDEVLTVKDAVHKLQLSLLEGIKHERQLFPAGSLLSRSDYQDVVTERTIAQTCGYPLCTNPLPAERPRKGRYRISLREHKVYDLEETYMYCSSGCLINSRAFAGSLKEERSSFLNPAKLNEILKMFDGLGLDSDVDMGKNGDLGMSGLKIKEKMDTTAGDVSLEEWIESKHWYADPNVADPLSFDMDFTSDVFIQDGYSIAKAAPPVKAKEQKGKTSTKEVRRNEKPIQKPTAPSENTQETKSKKSSLKTSDSKKATRSVTWADEKNDVDGQNLNKADEEQNVESGRFASAEALSEVGVVILPPQHGVDEVVSELNDNVTDTDPLQIKWPPKPGFSEADLLDPEDSWYDSPPEGFDLALSPFSTMFMALFGWISSSSLAYIYGKEDIFHEEYSTVNGREYPQKTFMPDGRSSEIRLTLEGCLSRALPEVAAELRLPIPISILEKGVGHLVNTMSFVDPLPPFKMRQWHVIVVLFLDALSVTRIPTLTPHMLSRRTLLPKVLEGAHISVEEFEIMKDLMIPLGRVPQFSTQSGG